MITSESTDNSPEEIIGEIIRKKIAVTA